MRVSKRVGSIAKSAIHEMTRLSAQYEDVAFLSWAKPTAGTPDHINRAAIKAIQNGSTGGYSRSEGLPELRREIAAKLRQVNGICADESEIIVTIGAIEGLAAAVMASVDPGDEVILPSPTYSTHIRQVQMAGGIPVFVPLDENSGFALDPEALRNAVTEKTRAILYCSPSNPTGTVFREKELREVASIAREKDLTVITDEAYEYFTYDGTGHFSIASIPGMKERTVSAFTFTKTYAMTGWRIGYIHSSAENIAQVKKAHIPFAICAPVASQYAALGALRGDQGCIGEFREHYLAGRNLMCERLDALDSEFSYTRPSGSYLMFPRIKGAEEKGLKSFDFCRKLLNDVQVSATPGSAFGPTGEHHLRLSFCVSGEMINKAFDRMDGYFKG